MVEAGRNKHIDPKSFSKEYFDSLATNEKIEAFVQGYRVPQKMDKAEALKSIRAKIEQTKADRPARMLSTYWMAAASVALVALLTTFYFYQSKPSQVFAQKGQHIEYTLPDGSNVSLNADSKISFSKSAFNKKRLLKLDGEAFFSVQKGSSFVVETTMGKIEVLGTSFNVYSRNQQFNVSCLSGKVKVTVADQTVVIERGEEAGLRSGVLQKTTNNPTETMADWRTGEFHFVNISLISIFEEIERQFNVTITTT